MEDLVVDARARLKSYTATEGQSEFPIPFEYDAASHVRVLHIATADGAETVWSTTTGPLAVAPAAGENGTVTLPISCAAGDKVIVYGETTNARAVNYGKKVAPKTLNTDGNRLIMLVQELRRDVDRSLKLRLAEAGVPDLRIEHLRQSIPYLNADDEWATINPANVSWIADNKATLDLLAAKIADGTFNSQFAPGINVKSFGSITADNLVTALATFPTFGVIIDEGVTLDLTAAEAVTLLQNFSRLIFLAPGTRLRLPEEVVQLTEHVDIFSPYGLNVSIEGIVERIEETATSYSIVSSAIGNHVVRFHDVSDTTHFTVGRVCHTDDPLGTGRVRRLRGGWKVVAKTADTVDVRMTHNVAALPSMTLTSIKLRPRNTVIKGAPGQRGIAIMCFLKEIQNVAIEGNYDISTGVYTDTSVDGLMIGSTANTPVTGLNESYQFRNGGTWLKNVDVLNWASNGIHNAGGSVYGVQVYVTGCGWRGNQASNAANSVFKRSVATGNWQGYETEAYASMVCTDSDAFGNVEENFYSINGFMNLNAAHSGDGAFGALGKNGAWLILDDGDHQENTIGISCVNSFMVVGAGAVIENNDTADTVVGEGGLVNGTGAGQLGVVDCDHDSGARLIKADGKLLRPQNILFENGGNEAGFNTTSIGNLVAQIDGAGTWEFRANGAFQPSNDNAVPLGASNRRPTELFAASGTISTSDARMKEGVAAIPDAVLDAWADVQWVQYRYKGRVRTHAGVIAQQVEAAFAARGLDAFEWGVLCFDAWDDAWEAHDVKSHGPADAFEEADRRTADTGHLEVRVQRAGDLYSVRYDEAQALEAALMRRALARAGIPLTTA